MTEQKQDTTVIVGGGHAAGALLANLLQQKYQGTVVLVGEEPYPPYQRPALSKAYLSGEPLTQASHVAAPGKQSEAWM